VKIKLITSVLLFWATLGAAQPFSGGRDRLIVGGNIGVFRISFDSFKRVFDERSGMTTGAVAFLKIRPPYYAAVKYHRFEKNKNLTIANITQAQTWEEQWYSVGVRYTTYGERRVVNHLGFGLAFYNIKETGAISVFGQTPGKRSASGFYLDTGIEYRFIKYASLDFGIEITSAGIEGKSGFEGSSVGGFVFEAGLNLFLF